MILWNCIEGSCGSYDFVIPAYEVMFCLFQVVGDADSSLPKLFDELGLYCNKVLFFIKLFYLYSTNGGQFFVCLSYY